MVLVRDMWLTGFDAPILHTMYMDKPMRGHGLMQAIARVNREFRDKPGGLMVDYLGLAHELKRVLAMYTESGGSGEATIDKEQAVRTLLEKYEVRCGLFHGFDRTSWTNGSPDERLRQLPSALEHVLAQEDGKTHCLKGVHELSQAFALAVPHPETVRIRDDVSLFQQVRSNVTIDWTQRKSVRANLRRRVRCVLRKHGYPPDKRRSRRLGRCWSRPRRCRPVERNGGHPFDTKFLGELTMEQQAAADSVLAHETGVLAATAAFGKTVVAAAVIAARGTNTLVLVHRRQLMEQWIARLGVFLDLPAAAIGQVGGGKRKTTGIVDVGIIQSLVRKGKAFRLV